MAPRSFAQPRIWDQRRAGPFLVPDITCHEIALQWEIRSATAHSVQKGPFASVNSNIGTLELELRGVEGFMLVSDRNSFFTETPKTETAHFKKPKFGRNRIFRRNSLISAEIDLFQPKHCYFCRNRHVSAEIGISTIGPSLFEDLNKEFMVGPSGR